MIRAEYPKVCPYLQEEKQKHLEMLAIEGTVIFQRLNRNVARMIHMGKLLRKIYEELKEMCLKADVDMLQVRTKDVGCRTATCLESTYIISHYILFDFRYSSDSKVQVLTLLPLWWQVLFLQYNLYISFAFYGRRRTMWKDSSNRDRKKISQTFLCPSTIQLPFQLYRFCIWGLNKPLMENIFKENSEISKKKNLNLPVLTMIYIAFTLY